MHFPSNNIKTSKSTSSSSSSSSSSIKAISVVKQTRSSDRKPPTVVKVLNEKHPKKQQQHGIKSPVDIPTTPTTSTEQQQAVGIHIDSPNSNVRIQGSKIEVKEKPETKRDLSEVILKVPDPSKFLTSPPLTTVDAKSLKPSSSRLPPPPLTPDKVQKPCSHNNSSKKELLNVKKDDVPPPALRRRPERSAKKRAKDSISEITEAERPMIEKDEFRHRERLHNITSPTTSSHPRWNSPPPPSRPYGRTDYYVDRSPPIPLRSPPVPLLSPPESHRHNHGHHSPFHRSQSPDHRSRSPTPLHIRHPPLSPPTRHRHSRSPHPPAPPHGGRHSRIHSPLYRDHEEHPQQHYHYNEPLSPRYRGGGGGSGHESPFYYSERSRSPYFYDYHRHENERERLYEELERRSPPIKHRRMTSPVSRERKRPVSREMERPVSRERERPVSRERYEPPPPVSPPQSRRHIQRNIHSPPQDRFPYGRTDWESSNRFRHHDHSPPVRSSPVDPHFQYQPLSRMPPKGDVPSPSLSSPKHHHDGHRFQRSKEPTSMHVHEKKKETKIHPKLPSSSPVLSPREIISPTPPKRSKVVEKERDIIEIPEKLTITPQQPKAPTPRKKGLGLLEMKIQGLKNKIEKTGVSEKIRERMNSQSEESDVTKDVKSKPSRSLSDVISSLSGSKPSGNKNMPALLSPPDLNKRKQDGVVSPILHEKSLSPRENVIPKPLVNKRSKSLADIAMNLTKSVEKQIVTGDSIIQSTPKAPTNTVVNSAINKGKSSGSKLSGVISSLKKSKEVVGTTSSSYTKDTAQSNDSKLLNILKSGFASKSTKTLPKKDVDITISPDELKKFPSSSNTKDSSSKVDNNSPPSLVSDKDRVVSPITVSKSSRVSPSNNLLTTKPLSDIVQVTDSSRSPQQPPPPPATETPNNEGKKLLEQNNEPSVSISERFISPAGSPVYSPPVACSPLTIVISKQKQTRSSSSESNATPVITPTRTPTPIMSPLSHSLAVVDSPTSNDSKSSTVFPASPPQLVDEKVTPSSKLTRPTAIIPTSVFESKVQEKEKFLPKENPSE